MRREVLSLCSSYLKSASFKQDMETVLQPLIDVVWHKMNPYGYVTFTILIINLSISCCILYIVYQLNSSFKLLLKKTA